MKSNSLPVDCIKDLYLRSKLRNAFYYSWDITYSSSFNKSLVYRNNDTEYYISGALYHKRIYK